MPKEESYTVTRKEEEKRLLKRSGDFLETAKYQISEGFYDLATFSLEQALELFLKAKVLAEGVDFPRTHSVRTPVTVGFRKQKICCKRHFGELFAGVGHA
jgi:hypothetical protein